MNDAEVTAAPAKEAKRSPPADLDVVLISIDSLRADMPWNGYERPIAPNLTKLAKTRATSYSHAYSLSSYTSMSLGGLLSGKLPGEVVRDGYFFGNYGKENLFFPEVLAKAGVHTMAAHAHGYFKDANFDQGFDSWEMVPGLKWNNTTDENSTAPDLEGIAERLLSDPANETRRFFAWFHFLDPHDQYMAHDGIDWGKGLRDRYDGEVTFCDRYVGKLLDFIATRTWAKRTVVIVTADHGELFGEHHRYLHGFELWEPLVRVPLLFVLPPSAGESLGDGGDAVPGEAAKGPVDPSRGRVIDTPRSARDLAPTILDLFGLPKEPSFEGESLVPELYGEVAPPRDVVIDLPATSDNDRRRAFLHGKYKLIAFGPKDAQIQVFDVVADPDEAKPLSGPEVDEVVRLYRELEKSVKDVPPTRCGDTCLNGAYNHKPIDP